MKKLMFLILGLLLLSLLASCHKEDRGVESYRFEVVTTSTHPARRVINAGERNFNPITYDCVKQANNTPQAKAFWGKHYGLKANEEVTYVTIKLLDYDKTYLTGAFFSTGCE